MKARVIGTYQVVHDGKRYVEGDELDAPEGDVQQWTTAGWVEQVRERKSAEKSDEKAQAESENKAQRAAPNKAARTADSK